MKSEQQAACSKRSPKYRLQNFGFSRNSRALPRIFFFLFAAYCFLASAPAQKIAVLVPEKIEPSPKFAEALESALAGKFKILDRDLSETAFRSVDIKAPFNLSIHEAKTIGAALGGHYFLLVNAKTLRRSSLSKNEYFESFAAVYAVSARTGRLAFWKLESFEAASAEKAEKFLLDSAGQLALEIAEKLKSVSAAESNELRAPAIEEVPDESAPDAKLVRPPLPFKRLKPAYTSFANLYGVEATIDIEVDIDETGAILRTEIVRWAGFGLDESVTETIRRMNWRAATRNGKPLPMRILLRYNFKKIEKEEN